MFINNKQRPGLFSAGFEVFQDLGKAFNSGCEIIIQGYSRHFANRNHQLFHFKFIHDVAPVSCCFGMWFKKLPATSC